MAGLDGGRLNIGACSLGGAQGALDRSIAYAKERKAFGSAIADFQALQFKLADMATELEAARSLLWRAAAALDAKTPDATKLCAMAKRVATDTGFGSPTTPCRFMAAMAISPITASRRSSATCASTRSSREPTR